MSIPHKIRILKDRLNAVLSIGGSKVAVVESDWRVLYEEFAKIRTFRILDYWRDPVTDSMNLVKGVSTRWAGSKSAWSQNLSFWFGVYEKGQIGNVIHYHPRFSDMVLLSQHPGTSKPLNYEYGNIKIQLCRDLRKFFIICKSDKVDEFYEVIDVIDTEAGFSIRASHFHVPRSEFVIEFDKRDLAEVKSLLVTRKIDLALEKRKISFPNEETFLFHNPDWTPRMNGPEAETRLSALRSWAQSLESDGQSAPSDQELESLAIYNPYGLAELQYMRSLSLISPDVVSKHEAIWNVLSSCRIRSNRLYSADDLRRIDL